MRLLLDALVPLRCAACAAPAPAGLCDPCGGAAQRLRLPAAPAHLAPAVVAVGVFAYAGVIRDAVHGMKLAQRHGAAVPLGRLVIAAAGPAAAWPRTWVPATPRRIRSRGMDLPRLLAGRGAVPLLRRVAERPDQTSLSPEQRRRSPAGAFVARGRVPPDVLLVDDVRTTGATAAFAAGALLDGGARRVVVATLAVGGDAARAALH